MDMVLQVKDLMTKKVATVSPDDSIVKAAQLLYSHNYHGIPVITKDRKVVGILTEHDFISKETNIHLPTLIELFRRIPFYSGDKMLISDEMKKISQITVKDIMNDDPILIGGDADVFTLAKIFTEHHKVNPVPVVDKDNRLMGVASRYDIIKLYIGATSEAGSDIEKGGADTREVSSFLSDFQKDFTVVSRFRSRFWLLISLLFVVIGFVLAATFLFHIGGS